MFWIFKGGVWVCVSHEGVKKKGVFVCIEGMWYCLLDNGCQKAPLCASAQMLRYVPVCEYFWITSSNLSRFVSFKSQVWRSRAALRAGAAAAIMQMLALCVVALSKQTHTNTHAEVLRVYLTAGAEGAWEATFAALSFIALTRPKASEAAANYHHLT